MLICAVCCRIGGPESLTWWCIKGVICKKWPPLEGIPKTSGGSVSPEELLTVAAVSYAASSPNCGLGVVVWTSMCPG